LVLSFVFGGERKKLATTVFTGKMLFLGCGSVGQCTLQLLLQHFNVKPENVTIVDMVDNRHRVAEILKAGATYCIEKITKEEYKSQLKKYVAAGDMLVDLSWNVGTMDMLDWCRSHQVMYINTSIEVWDPYCEESRKDPREHTLYVRQMELLKQIKRWGDNSGTSAILDHGANPGLVSHFTKHSLLQIATKIIEEKGNDPRRKSLEDAVTSKNFKKLAQLTGVKSIHISERDSQISYLPKRMNEFVNTWSVEGLREEGVAPAELGWGTHEERLPEGAFAYEEGPCNQICLSSIGMNTYARSWVPSGEIVGMVIRHGEAFGISDRLTVWEGNKAVYRPTVHYVYCPTDAAIASLHELKMRQYDIQPRERIMNDEIVDGADELGVLLMGHDYRAWWTGSVLDIHEARTLVPHQNATTVQVAISVLAAMQWMIKNPRSGVRLPDDIDHDFILEYSKPYLGKVVSAPVNWGPLDKLDQKYTTYGQKAVKKQVDDWQFETFRRGIL
jgi:homospermidine synthase